MRRHRRFSPQLVAPVVIVLAALACARADIPAGSTPVLPPETTYAATLPPTPEDTPADTLPDTPVPALTPSPSPEEPEPLVTPTFPPTPAVNPSEASDTVVYTAQAGDTLRTIAIRFAVIPEDIKAVDGTLPAANELVDPGQKLVIPRRLGATGPSAKLIPDSEMVFSPNAADFDVSSFVAGRGGYLNRYQEYISSAMRTGPEVVALVARDNSVNPRLLLALLEYQAGWVTNPTRPSGDAWKYPMGNLDPQQPGLFRQLTWVANELGNGYYGWRMGSLSELNFPDGSMVRLAPDLNAGTVALQYYFALHASGRDWAEMVSETGFAATYKRLFGDPFDYFHPLYEPGVRQPEMILPFLAGHIWSFTGGPHGAWERESAWAALDFAPATATPGCGVSDDWAVAAAPGLVVRSENGVVVLDLDGDGREQTGWSLLYLHIADDHRVPVNTFVQTGDLIGHPSCEGGLATGTHLHVARKYNGEWILADGPLPFELSGWVAKAGTRPYQGALINGGRIVLACSCASQETLISR